MVFVLTFQSGTIITVDQNSLRNFQVRCFSYEVSDISDNLLVASVYSVVPIFLKGPSGQIDLRVEPAE